MDSCILYDQHQTVTVQGPGGHTQFFGTEMQAKAIAEALKIPYHRCKPATTIPENS